MGGSCGHKNSVDPVFIVRDTILKNAMCKTNSALTRSNVILYTGSAPDNIYFFYKEGNNFSCLAFLLNNLIMPLFSSQPYSNAKVESKLYKSV